MLTRERKRLQARPKRNKRHFMVVFSCMNMVNNYAIQSMNARAQQQLYPSVI